MPIEASIWTPQQQLEDVRNVRDNNTYLEFLNAYFESIEGSTFKKEYYQTTRTFSEHLPEDYYKLLALVGTLSAQYGFPSMDGQIMRHKRKGWVLSSFHPLHQVALASYLGLINTQAFALKEGLVDQWRTINPEEPAIQGIWGYDLMVRGGEVMLPDNALNVYKKAAGFRAAEERTIFLTNVAMNQQFADLAYVGEYAERTDEPEAQEKIRIDTNKIVSSYLDFDSALVSYAAVI